MSMLGWGAVLTNQNILTNKVIVTTDCSWNMISYTWEFRWGLQQETQRLKNTRRWTLSARCVIHFWSLKLGPNMGTNSFLSDHLKNLIPLPMFLTKWVLLLLSRMDSEILPLMLFGLVWTYSIKLQISIRRCLYWKMGTLCWQNLWQCWGTLPGRSRSGRNFLSSNIHYLNVSIRAVVCNKQIRKGEKGLHLGLLDWRPCAC